MELALNTPPAAPPGTEFLYSNTGYALAGHMAEKAAGKAWESLLQELIFRPLAMRSAGFGVPGQPGSVDQPRGHTSAGQPIEPGPAADNPPAMYPAGGVHLSLEDWARFTSAWLRGAQGTSRFLKAATFKKMLTPPAQQDYAMGWGVVERPAGAAAKSSATAAATPCFSPWLGSLPNAIWCCWSPATRAAARRNAAATRRSWRW